ncbi:MAG: aminomethyltransferase [Nitrospirales bacterium]|nr:MAG: aminomethyltransferase [Nitrospirales bacterium]
MKHSPLFTQHEALGAQFQLIGDWEIPAHYGNATEEHLAVRQGVGIADLSLRGLNRITGDDRVAWLQNLISNDIRPLTAGQGLYSAFMDHKGKMLSYFRVLLLEDSIMLEDAGEVGDMTYQHLRKFLLFGTKAKMENCLESWGTLLLSGPSAPDLIQQAFSIDMASSKPLDLHVTEREGQTAIFVKTEETGEHDIEIHMPNAGLVSSWERLWAVGKPLGLRAIGQSALESLRLEAGIPKIGPDLNERIVPPEANLEGKAFSLTKGCYPGQEVVARMDTYGSVKRRLVGLLIDSPDNHLPEPGAKIFSGDREVGWVSSAAVSPLLKKPIAFGFPLRDFTKPQTELLVACGEERYPAVVHALPFALPQ